MSNATLSARLFRQLVWQDLLRHKTKTLLTIVSIALGVAVFLAINMANHVAISNFQQSMDRVAGKTNLQIVSTGPGAFSDKTLKNLAPLWDRDVKFTPVMEQTAVIPESPDHPQEAVQVFGADMLNDFAFRDYMWADNDTAKPDSFFSIFEQNTAFIGKNLADNYQLKTGDILTLYVNDQKARVKITGVLSEKGLGGAFSGYLLMMDIGPFQQLFRLNGKINRIDLIVPGKAYKTTTAYLQKYLPTGLRTQRPERRSEQVEKMLAAYQYNLTVLSFIALLVGMFLIYNTMSMTVIRRRTEIGTLRAVGVGKRFIIKLFMGEAVTLGVLGTGLGLLLGVGLAALAINAVSATVETLYTGQPVTGFEVSAVELLKAAVLGLTATIIGALAPVLEATTVRPAETTRAWSYEARIRRFSSGFSVAGFILLGAALFSAFQKPWHGIPVFGFLSAFFILLGCSFILPMILSVLFNALKPIIKFFFKEEGKLALLDLQGALGRTSVAIASLMIGIAMMVSLAVMIGSFRSTVFTWINQSLTSDIWIQPLSKGNVATTSLLNPKLVQTLKTLPGVEALDEFTEFPIEFEDEPANVGVGNFDVFAKYGKLSFLDGENTEAVIRRVIRKQVDDIPGVIVTEPFAVKHHVRKNDRFTLQTANGPQQVSVEGIYFNYVSEQGYIFMPRVLYQRLYHDSSISGISLFLKAGADENTVRQEIVSAVGPDTPLKIQTNRELREEIMAIFEKTFAITYALHVVAIIVALLAIMNSLFAMVMESRRTFGILKYIGTTRTQIRKIILIQAGLMGLFGSLSGFVVGLMLALLLIYIINKQSFGWTIQFSLPEIFLLQSFVIIMVTSVLSGWLPAKRASETFAPEVVRFE